MPYGWIIVTEFFFNYYSQTPLYGHPLNTDTSLLRTISFVPGEINSVTFSLNSTHFIRTPRQYGHFLWPCYCPNQCGLTVFLSTSSQFPLGVALDTSIQIRSGPCRRGLVFLKQNILYTFQGHPTSIFGKYVCCNISCLPASPGIFKHLKNGIIAHFYRNFTLKGHLEFSGDFFLLKFNSKSFDP